jgi:hypothetical protein
MECVVCDPFYYTFMECVVCDPIYYTVKTRIQKYVVKRKRSF